MPLDPSEVDAIARAVASLAMWGTAAGLIFAVFCGILIALKITVPFGANMVESKILDPKGAVQQARARELANFKTEVAAVLTDKLAALKFPESPKLEGLQIQLPTDAIEAAVTNAINKAKMAGVRAGRGDASEQDLDTARQAAANPEGAVQLAQAKRWVDWMAGQKLIKPASAKDWKGQLDEAFRSTGDIMNVLQSFGFQGQLVDLLNFGGGAKTGGASSERAGWVARL